MSKKKALIINTQEQAIDYLKKHINGLEFLDKKWQDDKVVVLFAVSRFGYALKDASARLKADEFVVRQAIKQSPRAITYADKSLRDDSSLRAFAYKLSNSVFLIDPVAIEIFSYLDNDMINSTVKKEPCGTKWITLASGTKKRQTVYRNAYDEYGQVIFDEEAMREHPTYKRFKSIYTGTVTATEILEFEKILTHPQVCKSVRERFNRKPSTIEDSKFL